MLLPLGLTAQKMEFGAGILKTEYLSSSNSYYSSASLVPLSPEFQISIFDLKNRNKLTGFSFGYYRLNNTIHDGFDHHGCGYNRTAKIVRNVFSLQHIILNSPVFKSRLDWYSGLGYSFLLSQKTNGRKHEYCGIPMYYLDTTFHFHSDKENINRTFGFGILGGIRWKIVHKNHLSLGVKNSAYLGVISDYNLDAVLTPIRFSAQIFAAWQLYTPEELERKKIYYNSQRVEDKKNSKKEKNDRRLEKNAKQLRKIPINDKNFEVGCGFNTYLLSFRSFGAGGQPGLGFGFGLRYWGHPSLAYIPGFSINFQQENANLETFLLGSSTVFFGGKMQRNILSVGFYPLKIKLFQKRLDIRLGADFGFLLSNRLRGDYVTQNFTNNTYISKYITHDELHFQRKFSCGPIVSISAPLLRKENYCLKWRFTSALTYYDIDMDIFRGRGFRNQCEMVYCFKL